MYIYRGLCKDVMDYPERYRYYLHWRDLEITYVTVPSHVAMASIKVCTALPSDLKFH